MPFPSGPYQDGQHPLNCEPKILPALSRFSCLVAGMRELINALEKLKHSDLPIVQVLEKEAEKAFDGPSVRTCPLPT